MTRCAPVALAAVAAVFSAPLAAAESPVPERLLFARYIALGYDLGDRIVPAEQVIGDPGRVTPEEREALEEIRGRLEGWDRYVVVNRGAQADLLLVVRSGRRASAGIGSGGGIGGGGIGVRGPGGSGFVSGQRYGGELSSPDDMLAVYDMDGGPSSALWRALAPGGLSGEIPLFEAFQDDVERAAARRKRP